jgi:hypothetical protein
MHTLSLYSIQSLQLYHPGRAAQVKTTQSELQKQTGQEQAFNVYVWMSNLIHARQSANHTINTILHLSIKGKMMRKTSLQISHNFTKHSSDKQKTIHHKPNESKLTCVVYPLNSCPRVKGVASWVCVRPILTISLNSIDWSNGFYKNKIRKLSNTDMAKTVINGKKKVIRITTQVSPIYKILF